MDLTDGLANRAPRRAVVLNEAMVVNRRRVEDQEESLTGTVADVESRPADAIASAVTAGNLVHFPWEEWNRCGQKTGSGLSESNEIAAAGNMTAAYQRS
jgi:hypothetical protein